MATFAQAHKTLLDYTARFNRLALKCASEGRSEIDLERRDELGPYPKGIPYQWRRRMPDVVCIAPWLILEHRSHLDRALPGMCQARVERPEGRSFNCPIGLTQYTGLTRQEIDGR